MTAPRPLRELGLSDDELQRLDELARQVDAILAPRIAAFEARQPKRRTRSVDASVFLVMFPALTVLVAVAVLVATIGWQIGPWYFRPAVGWIAGYTIAAAGARVVFAWKVSRGE